MSEWFFWIFVVEFFFLSDLQIIQFHLLFLSSEYLIPIEISTKVRLSFYRIMFYREHANEFFHWIFNLIGLAANSALILLILFKTPKNLQAYAVYIGNFALTDYTACFLAIFVMQRWEKKSRKPNKFRGWKLTYTLLRSSMAS